MDSRRLIALALMLGMLVAPLAGAMGLGEAKVRSSLGQPLLIEIPLAGASASEIEEIQLRIGGQTDFERLSLSYDHAVAAMRLDTVQHDGQWWAQVKTREPFRQPIVEFPLTLFFRGDRVVRAYTLLVDPPNYRQAVNKPATSQRSSAPRRPRPAVKTGGAESPVGNASRSGIYRVRPGDTLWPIAQQFKPAGMNTRQMMDALLRDNPQAFINGNINLLRAGAELRLPGNVATSPVAASASPGPNPSASPSTSPNPSASAKPAPAEPPAAAKTRSGAGQNQQRDEKDRLQVVTEVPDATADQVDALRQRVLLTHEEVEKNRLEQQELRGELQTLKQELVHLERLVELKDEQIAALRAIVAQQQAAAALATKDTRPAPPAPAPAKAAEATASVTAELPPAQPFPWWWIVAPMVLLLAIVALMFYVLYRRTESHPNVRLADLPAISNAPPPPYSQPQPGRAAEQAASQPPQGSPQGSPPRASRTAPPEPAGQPQRPMASSASLLDESLAELPSFVMHGSGGDTGLASGNDETSREIGVEEHVSEEELAELAKQLDAESELAITELTHSTGAPAEANSDASGFDLSLDLDSGLDFDQASQLDADSAALDELEPSESDAELTLDMARAYLELGDIETAVELLQASLESATHPGLRGQIQALLDQYA